MEEGISLPWQCCHGIIKSINQPSRLRKGKCIFSMVQLAITRLNTCSLMQRATQWQLYMSGDSCVYYGTEPYALYNQCILSTYSSLMQLLHIPCPLAFTFSNILKHIVAYNYAPIHTFSNYSIICSTFDNLTYFKICSLIALLSI